MINKVILLGNITKDPEVKKSKSGKKYARFTIALNEKDKTTFVTCVAFEKTAEVIKKYFVQGSFIGVTGRLDIQKKDDKYYTIIIVNDVSFAGYKKDEVEVEEKEDEEEDEEEEIEDLPF